MTYPSDPSKSNDWTYSWERTDTLPSGWSIQLLVFLHQRLLNSKHRIVFGFYHRQPNNNNSIKVSGLKTHENKFVNSFSLICLSLQIMPQLLLRFHHHLHQSRYLCRFLCHHQWYHLPHHHYHHHHHHHHCRHHRRHHHHHHHHHHCHHQQLLVSHHCHHIYHYHHQYCSHHLCCHHHHL